jgi:hypothetical protein
MFQPAQVDRATVQQMVNDAVDAKFKSTETGKIKYAIE